MTDEFDDFEASCCCVTASIILNELRRLREHEKQILDAINGKKEDLIEFTTKKIDAAELRRRTIRDIYLIIKGKELAGKWEKTLAR